MDQKWSNRFANIRVLGWFCVAGAACIPVGIASYGLFGENGAKILLIVGIFLFFPPFVYIYAITILHWKDRYRGKHSDLWGILILVETSGWSKLVYFFRHLRPDMNNTGRYRRLSVPPSQ
jgi:hypothetical protein